MSSFRDAEAERLAQMKRTFCSEAACRPGLYRNVAHAFCLAGEHAAENLHESLRASALAYFSERGIPWQGGSDGLPSNNLCDSQVACVNTLYPLASNREALTRLLRVFLPRVAEVLPFEANGVLPEGGVPALAFAWAGGQNYLGERRRNERTTSATNADFALRFRRYDGQIELVLGIWKYTESYGATLPDPEVLNADRLATYRPHFARWRERRPDLPAYESLFSDPFYQFMRLTLLAQAMERAQVAEAGEMGATVVSLMLVAPAANQAFAHSIPSTALERYGATVAEVWQRLAPEGRFLAIESECFLSALELVVPPPLNSWCNDLLRRYGWWRLG